MEEQVFLNDKPPPVLVGGGKTECSFALLKGEWGDKVTLKNVCLAEL